MVLLRSGVHYPGRNLASGHGQTEANADSLERAKQNVKLEYVTVISAKFAMGYGKQPVK